MSTSKPIPPKALRRPAKPETENFRQGGPSIPLTMPFTPANYRYLLIGLAILVIGFVLLSLEDFIDATQFSIALYIAPFVIVGGYVFLAWAIMKRPRPLGGTDSNPS